MLSFEWNFLGLSNEVKPIDSEKVIDGSTFYECDTGKFFIFYNGTWYEQTFVTEDGINVYVYKYFMRKLFKRSFDTNISKLHIYKPEISSNIEVTTDYPAIISDISLYGDTTQQTYTGKNIEDFTTISFSSANSGSGTRNDGVYTITGNTNDGFGGIQFVQSDLQLEANTTYTFSAKVVSTTTVNGSRVYITSAMNNNGGLSGNLAKAGEISQVTFTTPDSISSSASIRIYSSESNTTTVFTDIQLEKGSTATSYEPYVGGIPAPNPDYPQDVNVVTGEQTITINEDELTIDLGNLELCKIGNHQDYIYKSGDDWYVHKVIGKVDIISSGIAAFNTHGGSHITVNYSDANVERLSAPSVTNISNRFIGCTNTQTWGGTVLNGVSQATNNNYLQFSLPISVATTQAEVRTYFDNHPTLVYYTLATPTDTQITDTDLIAGLNNLLGYNLPEGTITITVTSDNLPAKLGLIITERE